MIAAVAETIFSMFTLDASLPTLVPGGLYFDFSTTLNPTTHPYAVFSISDIQDDTLGTRMGRAEVVFSVMLLRGTGYAAAVTTMRRFKTVYDNVVPPVVSGYRFHKMTRLGGRTLSPDLDVIGFEDRYSLRVEET